MRSTLDRELQRKTKAFMSWQVPFIEDISRLYTYGFKGYLIKKDGTVETIIDPMYQRQIDEIRNYIDNKRKDFFKI